MNREIMLIILLAMSALSGLNSKEPPAIRTSRVSSSIRLIERERRTGKRQSSSIIIKWERHQYA